MNYYHVYCRGIEKKDIFLDDMDHDRFVQSLWVFNNKKRTRFNLEVNQDREILIDLINFCLMPNHFHLLIRAEESINMSKYMQKLMIAYTMYFKKKYKKDGRVFESKYRQKHIETDRYLRHISDYIHNNPLRLKYKNYKSINLLLGFFVLDENAKKWLKEYKYSSHNYKTIKPPLTASLDLD